jgi:hypothetical protein
MKNLLLLLAVICVFQGAIFSQSCLPEGITFHYQYEIDNFQANYPGCTEIEGDVLIGPGGYIYNLDGLSVLSRIGGGLRMYFNPDLTSISGLHNITSIGGWLFIEENEELTSLEGLENLDTIGGDLRLRMNGSLYDIEALSGLDYVGGDLSVESSSLHNLAGLENISVIEGYVRIVHNNDLTSLTGLEGLSSIGGYLDIERNKFLVSLAGLANLTSVGNDFRLGTGFGGNHDLISLAGLSNLHTIGGNLWILDNISLKSLSGLDSLISIGGRLEIKENDSLASLAGIDNIAASTITAIQIINNDTLASCNVMSLCEYLIIPGGSVEIHGNEFGCNSQEEVLAACAVGIEESAVGSLQSAVGGQRSAVKIIPNPASTTITIKQPGTSSKFLISIFNLNGQEMMKQQASGSDTDLDISTLPGGVYFVRIVDEGSVLVGKFVKM